MIRGGRALLVVGSILATCALLEVGLRLVPPGLRGYDVEGRRFVKVREFTRDFTGNSLRFHDVEHVPGPSERVRVLLLGDSYVEANSVAIPQTVGQQLETHLNAGGDRVFEVISAGASSWGQQAQYRQLVRLGPIYQPAVVVTLFVSLNDVRDDSDELQRLRRAHDRAMIRQRPGWARLRFGRAPGLLVEWSELNRFLSYRLAILRERRRHAGAAGGDGIPFDYFVYRTTYDPPWERAWELKRQLVADTRRQAEALGARYLVVSASTPHGQWGADAGLARLVRAYPQMASLVWDLDRPDRLLGEICAAEGVPFLRLEPLVRARTREGARLHWRYDGHWNADGNREAGRLIAGFILETLGG